ncbi:GvpL/GvpF family gas vesicle protein [Nocardioides sp. LHG3406-4]|uniref:GvpL/GvpF family gas vesicle protein n=1 Tax=Nocardioides sp. LHG3406-4 TaxID=2804575 RepID=UPI003CFAE02D
MTVQDVNQDVGCFVYAVVRAQERRALPATGVDGAPLRLVAHGSVAAVVNDIDIERPPGRRADLLAYSRAVDELLAGGVVVPVRFGSVLPDEEAVREDFLAPNEDYFAELLDQLEGRAQFNLTATYREGAALAEIVAADPVVADLRQRTRDLPEDASYADRVRLGELVSRHIDAKREIDTDELVGSVLPFVAAHHLQVGAGLDVVFDLNVLVDDRNRARFEQHLEDLAEAVHERIGLRLVGPVAPYDFVGGV